MKMFLIKSIPPYFLCFFAFVLFSCNNTDSKSTISTESIIQSVDTIVAIGKVTSENDNAIISSNTRGIVKEIFVKEGDTVNAGIPIIKLSSELEDLDLKVAKTKLLDYKVNTSIIEKNIDQEIIQLEYDKNQYLTTKSLYEKQAETKENYLKDELNYRQQQQVVEAIKKQIIQNQHQINAQNIEIEKSKAILSEYTLHAPIEGIITNLNILIGQNVSNSESLGEIINVDQVIIEAEVDELFADQIVIGQKVSFININTKQRLGEGHITYASPILANKSILYETANEADDRRVRKIKIKPTTSQKLLINSKVECLIKIR